MEEREVCVELDSVLVELMECLSQLEVLRRRFAEAVSEVSQYKHQQLPQIPSVLMR